MKKTILFIWIFLRLPILAAGLYLFRNNLANLIETYFNLAEVIEAAIYIVSTIWTRLILYLICVGGLITVYKLTTWIKSRSKSYILFLLLSSICIFISFEYLLKTPASITRTGVVIFLLAINTLPLTWLGRLNLQGKITNFIGIVAVGIDEAFFPQAYFLWLAEKFQRNVNFRRWSWLGGVLLAPMLWVFLLTPYNNQRILTLGEKLHASPAVEKFSDEGYNWIEYNPEHHLLYVVGHNVNYLTAYDTENISLPPLKSKTRVGKPQSFAFNPELQEVYVYRADTQELLYLDALTLDVTRSIPIPNLSPGDVWVKWNRLTDRIIVSSEADRQVGTPFWMIDRASGEIVGSMPLPVIPTAYLVFHPEKPILYFNSFRDTYLVAWDMTKQEVLLQSTTRPRTDRMEFDPARNEILIASPQDGTILRYDADTLDYKGEIDTSFGARTLTIDSKRNLLLVGNFINNHMQVIDLNTRKVAASYYIGPWIRTIALDEEAGIAYVSTAGNLFRVSYISIKYFTESH